jgi:flagellar biosynthesis protein FlhB
MKKYINLQLFATDGKTEKATSKKRQDARKKGQVLQSREVAAAVILIFVFVSLRLFGGYIYGELGVYIKRIFTVYLDPNFIFASGFLPVLFNETLTVAAKIIAPVFIAALVVGLIVEYAQVGFLFTIETLSMKFSRLSPANGFKRIFSTRAAVELFKSLIKITVIGFVVYIYLKGETVNVLKMMNMDIMSLAIYIGTISINLAIRICGILVFLGALDYFYQWWEFEKSLKMSKHEVKEEYKQIEGNPEIKSKIKQKQREISMRRMLADVPKADVIITNPTHFAVAIKYDANISDAPLLTAKGQDYMALRIKETAKENKVEIIENKMLARTIYETVEIGQAIPPDLYQAVAEVLAFVYNLRGKGREAGAYS